MHEVTRDAAARRPPWGLLRAALRAAGIVAVLYAAGMLAVYGFSVLGMRTLIGFPVFILGIMIASIETDSGVWGAALGLLYLVSYDLLFAAPKYRLVMVSRTDVVALVIFMVVALIMNSLTRRMRLQAEISARDAAAMSLLNKVSSGLIDSSSALEACACAERFLTTTFGRAVTVRYGEPPATDALAHECYERNYQTGYGEVGSRDASVRYLPLSSKDGVYGVVGVDCVDGDLDATGRTLLSAVITQTVIAIERNELEEKRQRAQIEVERERFRGTLLRGVSHDLRTPLTSITGNVEFLLWNAGADEATRHELLTSVLEDARWLSAMVDNLLSMTRVQDASTPLEKSPETVDDVVGAAVALEEKRRGSHALTTRLPDEILVVPMDGRLIEQVLVNLIENAFKHTRPDASVEVSAWEQDGVAHFAVADDGGGMDDARLERVFDSFYTTGSRADAARAAQASRPAGGGRRGVGLGLSICKAIVEAHDGTITARNNDRGGATFEFTLPMEGDSDANGDE
ncbi:DUF4118 domain-containing protein [bacterium]|nr:DUF4118 domain-containing protein [bacterium]